MRLQRFEFNYFGENTYLMWDDASGEAAIVDPGMMNKSEEDILDTFISRHNLHPQYILLTHAHVDHTLGVDHLKAKYCIEVLAHKADAPLAMIRDKQASMFHMPVKTSSLDIDKFIDARNVLHLGSEEIRVIETPGHSRGGICFYVPESGFILTGDTIFQHSIGRTDFPEGNGHQLIESIRTQLLPLPDDTVIFPGHGPSTTIGDEKMSNLFL